MKDVRPGTDDIAAVLAHDLERVADLAATLLELPSEAEIYRRVGTGVQQIVGDNAIVVVTNKVPKTQLFKTQAVVGLHPILEKATALFGKAPEEIGGDWPESAKRAMATGRLTRLEGGVQELVGDAVPEVVCRQAQALFGIGDVFVVGFAKGESAGGICIITRQPATEPRRATVEALARLAAVALERKRLEEQLLLAQKMEAVGQLTSGVAHDFNNVLAAMILQIDVLRLRRDLPPETVHRAMDELLESANRATSVVRRLLLFGRRQAMELSRHDVNAVVSDWATLLRRLLGEKIVLEIDGHDEPLWIDGDAGMIEQAVMNLCLNARDAMPDGGRLTVAIRPVELDPAAAGRHPGVSPGRFVRVRVEDTGCGMDPTVVARLFEPFFTTKEPGKGTGLGLSIVHGIVARHGGFMEVESRLGAGSAFSVYLPRAEPAGDREPRGAPSRLAGGSERILVVEDEPAVRRVAVLCLRELGYRVTEAEDAADALRIWEAEGGRFDLLFTDMVMPGGLSGLELCSRLRRTNASLKAVVVSGYCEGAADAPTDWPAHVTFLGKPYDLRRLSAVVRRCFDGDAADALFRP